MKTSPVLHQRARDDGPPGGRVAAAASRAILWASDPHHCDWFSNKCGKSVLCRRHCRQHGTGVGSAGRGGVNASQRWVNWPPASCHCGARYVHRGAPAAVRGLYVTGGVSRGRLGVAPTRPLAGGLHLCPHQHRRRPQLHNPREGTLPTAGGHAKLWAGPDAGATGHWTQPHRLKSIPYS